MRMKHSVDMQGAYAAAQRGVALCIHNDATFSDIEKGYPFLTKALLSDELLCKELDPINRLLRQFLQDPDIRSRWSAAASDS